MLAQAGIQTPLNLLDSRRRGNDNLLKLFDPAINARTYSLNSSLNVTCADVVTVVMRLTCSITA